MFFAPVIDTVIHRISALVRRAAQPAFRRACIRPTVNACEQLEQRVLLSGPRLVRDFSVQTLALSPWLEATGNKIFTSQ